MLALGALVPCPSTGVHPSRGVYSPEVVTVLRVIKTAQRLGFTLDEVAELLHAGAHRHGLAGVACAACCAIPLLIAAGVLGGASWAAAGRVLPGVAIVLTAAAAGAWWWATRRRHVGGCRGGNGCDCDRGERPTGRKTTPVPVRSRS